MEKTYCWIVMRDVHDYDASISSIEGVFSSYASAISAVKSLRKQEEQAKDRHSLLSSLAHKQEVKDRHVFYDEMNTIEGDFPMIDSGSEYNVCMQEIKQ